MIINNKFPSAYRAFCLLGKYSISNLTIFLTINLINYNSIFKL